MPIQREIIVVEPQHTAVVRGRVGMDGLADFYDHAFPLVAEAAGAQGLTPQAAFGLYLSEPREVIELEVGFVVDSPAEEAGGVVPSQLPGGEVARAVHVGAYEGLGEAWAELMHWIGTQDRSPGGPMWEVYVTDPTPETDPSTLETHLFCLLAPAD